MEEMAKYCQISDEDLRAALKEMKTYMDITEDDLKKSIRWHCGMPNNAWPVGFSSET